MNSQIRTFAKDASFAVMSQLISLLSGLVLSFILPKYISVANYGYWQLFILYTGYVGFLHFGFNDGLYLKLGGKTFESLNKKELNSSMCIMLIQQVLLSSVLLGAILFFENNPIKRTMFIILAFYVVVENFYKTMSFVLMATGRVNFYSRTVIYEKSLLLLSILLLIIYKPQVNVGYYMSAFALAHFVVLLVTTTQFRGFVIDGLKNLNRGLSLYIDSTKVGFVLLFSNLCSTFIVGSGRFVIEKYWNIEMFARVSLALTLSAFLLFFVSQISYVLFPYIRRARDENQAVILERSTFVLTVCAVILFAMFFPLYYVTKYWLPQYSGTLPFLIILAPLSFYDIKTNLIYNTFFKNLNKVKPLFTINFLTLCLALLIYLTSAQLGNIYTLVGGMLFAVVFKSVIMQYYLFKHYSLKVDKASYMEFFITIILILSYALFGMSALMISYVILVLVFIMFNKRNIMLTVKFMQSIKK